MGPAQLPQAELQLTIYRPAVAGDDAFDLLPEQGGQAGGAAAGQVDLSNVEGHFDVPRRSYLD
jgi:hypothetical protein